MDNHQAIGRAGALPWRLPADLAYFKEVTLGKPIIMGRRTFDSIGRPLPGRCNIVLSRDPAFQPAGVCVAADLKSALAEAASRESDEIMIIGGAAIYQLALPHANRLYLTVVQAEVPDCDAHFPSIDWPQWEEIRRIERPADERNAYPMSFVVLDRLTRRLPTP